MAENIDEKVASMSLEEKKQQPQQGKKDKAAKKKGKPADSSSEPLEVKIWKIELVALFHKQLF